MNEAQADQIIDLLGEMLDEMRGLRSDFNEFTGFNVDSMQAVSERISDDICDRISGGIGGIGGATLGELSAQLNILTATVR